MWLNAVCLIVGFVNVTIYAIEHFRKDEVSNNDLGHLIMGYGLIIIGLVYKG